MAKKKRRIPRRRKPSSDFIEVGGKDFVNVEVHNSDGTVTKQRMTREEMDRVVQSTKFVQNHLTPEQESLCRFSYKHAGRLIQPTYEQWENGFMQERFPDKELAFWVRMVGLLEFSNVGDDEAATAIIGDVCASRMSGSLAKTVSEFDKQFDHEAMIERALRECGSAD